MYLHLCDKIGLERAALSRRFSWLVVNVAMPRHEVWQSLLDFVKTWLGQMVDRGNTRYVCVLPDAALRMQGGHALHELITAGNTSTSQDEGHVPS